jgi:hypothetical protein
MFSPLVDVWQGLWQAIRNLFRRRRSLSDFSLDELRTERVRLETAEQRIVRDLERLEQEKVTLFEAAKRETSQTTRVALAGKIRNINQRIGLMQGNLTRIGKLLRVVEQLIDAREVGRLQPDTNRIVDAILQTDGLALADWAEQMVAGQVVTEQKVDEIVRAFEEAGQDYQRLASEDREVGAILAEIERARAAEATAEELGLAEGQPTRQPEPPQAEA